jgi:stearoyl-CoA desaturase (delta-9 desaturase)
MEPTTVTDSDSRERLIPYSRRRNRISFWLIHAFCIPAFWTDASPAAIAVCLGFFLTRLFAITGWYHRYFSHHSFRTTRSVQFAFAFLGCMAAQKGPLWWASHHREHHMYSDTPRDPHSPVMKGFWWSHMLWFLDPASYPVKEGRIRDFIGYRELRWLERYHWTAVLGSMASLFLLGHGLDRFFPSLGTSGLQMLVWGFFISTVLTYHATFSVNSLGHRVGWQRYHTGDESRNSAWLALFTLGEGWHNNHHRFPLSARLGFFWWEFDPTYYGLRLLSALGLIWDLKGVPQRVKEGTPTDAADTA